MWVYRLIVYCKIETYGCSSIESKAVQSNFLVHAMCCWLQNSTFPNNKFPPRECGREGERGFFNTDTHFSVLEVKKVPSMTVSRNDKAYPKCSKVWKSSTLFTFSRVGADSLLIEGLRKYSVRFQERVLILR